MTSAADASKDDRGRRATVKRQIFHLPCIEPRVSYFNADDRAAELNGGSYVGIPKHLRIVVNRDFEAFVLGCLERRASNVFSTEVLQPLPAS